MTRDYAKFLQSFEACEIDASEFGHIDHVGVAFEMLRKYDFLNAAANYSTCINTIATRAGAEDKFNTTITLAFLSLIAERMQVSQTDSFAEFIEENVDLMSGNLLARWYSKDRLTSDLARSVFLMPDVAA